MDDAVVARLDKALDNENNASVMNLTHAQIMQCKNDVLQKLQLSSSELKVLHKKLKHYRYVEEATDINYGAYIRWINLSNPEDVKLTNGGILVDVKVTDCGLQLLCRNNTNRIMQLKLDECLVFQKLSDQESVILSVLNHLK